MTDTPSTPAGEPTDPWFVDRLLSGAPLHPGAGASAQAMEEIVAALQAPATAAELAGEAAALDAFDGVVRGRQGRHKTARRVSAFGAIVGGKIALAAGTAAAATTVAVAAAAYTGVLPTPVQNFAHHVIGAPAAAPPTHGTGVANQLPAAGASSTSPAPSASGTSASGTSASGTESSSPASANATTEPAGPSTPPAAAVAGLCRAYAAGNADKNSVAFQRLEALAGGASNVASFCADATAAPAATSATTHGPPPSTGPHAHATPTHTQGGH